MVGASILANYWEQLSPNVRLPKLRENSVDYCFDGRVVMHVSICGFRKFFVIIFSSHISFEIQIYRAENQNPKN